MRPDRQMNADAFICTRTVWCGCPIADNKYSEKHVHAAFPNQFKCNFYVEECRFVKSDTGCIKKEYKAGNPNHSEE